MLHALMKTILSNAYGFYDVSPNFTEIFYGINRVLCRYDVIWNRTIRTPQTTFLYQLQYISVSLYSNEFIEVQFPLRYAQLMFHTLDIACNHFAMASYNCIGQMKRTLHESS